MDETLQESISPELVEAAAEYTANVLDDYEHSYFEYLAAQTGEKVYAPAISAKDLFLRPALPVTSYVPGFIYAGCLNLIAGEPKAGKSTLTWHLINACSRGEFFLGTKTQKTNVVYVTEQNEVSFRQETATIPGFSDNPNVFILLPEDTPAASWAGRIESWAKILKASESSILVIDTFGAFSNLPLGGENDAACIAERMMTLKQLYKVKPNLAIVLIHHIRKPSADPRFPVKEFADLRDARGSSAIIGSVDHCVLLSKGQQDRVRNIHTEGLLEAENKFSLVLTDNGYAEHRAYRNNIQNWR